MSKKVSEAVIRRLPKYYRCLCELEAEKIDRVSSHKLSQRMGFTASQIRQDFNCFGGFGQQGYGYNVTELKKQIRSLLGLGTSYSLIVIGAGNIGQALANYSGFEREGFKVNALFDNNPHLANHTVSGIKILHTDQLEEYLQNNLTDIAVISVPQQAAQEITDRVCQAGIKFIWNFSPRELKVPNDVAIENVNLSDSLYMLSYKIKNET